MNQYSSEIKDIIEYLVKVYNNEYKGIISNSIQEVINKNSVKEMQTHIIF